MRSKFARKWERHYLVLCSNVHDPVFITGHFIMLPHAVSAELVELCYRDLLLSSSRSFFSFSLRCSYRKNETALYPLLSPNRVENVARTKLLKRAQNKLIEQTAAENALQDEFRRNPQPSWRVLVITCNMADMTHSSQT